MGGLENLNITFFFAEVRFRYRDCYLGSLDPVFCIFAFCIFKLGIVFLFFLCI